MTDIDRIAAALETMVKQNAEALDLARESVEQGHDIVEFWRRRDQRDERDDIARVGKSVSDQAALIAALRTMGFTVERPDMTDLRTLAEAATPGPWTVDGALVMAEGSDDPLYVGVAYEANPAFIAAASPEVVLALLDVVDAAIGLRDHTHLMHDTEYDTDALWQALYRYKEVSRDPA